MDVSLSVRAGAVSAALLALATLDLAAGPTALEANDWLLAAAGALPVLLLALLATKPLQRAW